MMKILRLDHAQRTLFSGLDPFEELNRLKEPGTFAIIAARETADEDIPAGILIAELTEARLFIRWLFVFPEERGKGAGEDLLGEAVRIAESEGCRLITAVIQKRKEWISLCPNVDKYLEERGFELDRQLSQKEKTAWMMTTSTEYFRKEKQKWDELPYSKQLELLAKEGLL